MNRKFVLAFICAAALGLAGLQAFAQDKPDQSSQPPADPAAQQSPSDQNKPSGQYQPSGPVSDAELVSRVDARLQQLTSELGLSDDQKGQIKPILLNAAVRIKAVKNDPQRSVDSKQSKMDEIHDSARGQLRQFLTPDQSKKLDAMKADDVI